ncbi:4-aminobutyrate aminotransferase-like enzyme [Bradyrhizobium sp. JR7.2]|uniref:Aspartate aminotransferase family protein n=1 Tax=Bradyrhizobium barranii TaxID=2992140 RepID=A0ABY3QVP3_9BRAD|nr:MULTISPECIES: aspartate aminotransferase family protein [Bradyrhizobium]UFW89698.1 aspartate aminotransferase family protein [Bradyrhizobium japonicum]WFT98458.1 aspartate aminotransferase family protein [Bradyrhizobium barranii]CUU20085.1 aminotransferase class III CDS [Bradyrhizobium sp.]
MSRLLRTGLNAGEAAPMAVVGGEGVYFHLSDGRKLIDGSNTGGGLGHRHPAMVEAIRRAADTPVVNEGWTWVGREQAADDLMATAFKGEDDWVGAVRFCISGSEANDMALSLCQALTQRSALATRERAYHGITGLSRAMTVQPQWHGGLAVHAGGSKLPAPMAPVRVLPAPDGAIYGAPANNTPPSEYLADATRLLSDTAATIIDYTQGGIYYDGAYQDEVARCAREAGSYWIADEVVTGAGRAGRWFAFQGAESHPDIVTLGKSLGGGAAAVAAVVVSKDIVERLKGTSWQNYGTLRGHPISMAAVSAYLKVVSDDKILEHVRKLEKLFTRRLLAIAQKHPSVQRVAGQGLHWTVELHGPDWRAWHADTTEVPIASRVAERALEAGAVIGTSGEQTSLFLAPPLVISEQEAERLLDALDHGLDIADEEHG